MTNQLILLLLLRLIISYVYGIDDSIQLLRHFTKSLNKTEQNIMTSNASHLFAKQAFWKSNHGDKFRFSRLHSDRIVDVHIDGDPWSNAGENYNRLYHVHFAGLVINTAETSFMHTQLRQFFCEFSKPSIASSKVELRSFENPREKQRYVQLSCELIVRPKQGEIIELQLVEYINGRNKSRLHNITIEENHDKCKYGVSIATMTNDLLSTSVVEWIAYHSLLGVDHFIIYYHSHSMELSVELQHFVSIGVVTIVSFPFIAHSNMHWNAVQLMSLNCWLKRFGFRSQFIGTLDIDEYYLPPASELNLFLNFPRTINPFQAFLTMKCDDNCVGLAFDTVEMGCIGEVSYHRPTHCLRQGERFNSQIQGHGKVFIRPEKLNLIDTPHRIHHAEQKNTSDVFLYGVDDSFGEIFHFNNLKYSYKTHSVSFSKKRPQETTNERLKLFIKELIDKII